MDLILHVLFYSAYVLTWTVNCCKGHTRKQKCMYGHLLSKPVALMPLYIRCCLKFVFLLFLSISLVGLHFKLVETGLSARTSHWASLGGSLIWITWKGLRCNPPKKKVSWEILFNDEVIAAVAFICMCFEWMNILTGLLSGLLAKDLSTPCKNCWQLFRDIPLQAIHQRNGKHISVFSSNYAWWIFSSHKSAYTCEWIENMEWSTVLLQATLQRPFHRL